MKRLTLLLLLCLPSFGQSTWTGILTTGRAIDWANNSGIPGGIPSGTWANCVTTACNTAFSTPTAANINTAVAGAPNNTVVRIPAGTISGAIHINRDNVVLRGAGPTTILTGTFLAGIGTSGQGGAPSGMGSTSLSTFTRGSTVLTVGSTASLVANQVVIVDQLNDSSVVNVNGFSGSENAGRCAGPTYGFSCNTRGQLEMVQIQSVDSATQITIKAPGLSRTLSSGLTPQIFFYTGQTSNDGIENLKVNASNSFEVSFPFCNFCWAKNISVISTAIRGSIYFLWAYRGEVRDSYVQQNNASGAPTQYGIECDTCTFAKIENNIIFGVTAPLMLESTYGTVIGYNYILNTSTGAEFSGVTSHRSHDFLDLVEGNSGANLSWDFIWGGGGLHTSFRNSFNGNEPNKNNYRIATQVSAWHRYTNIVANVLGDPTFHTIYETNPTNSCNDQVVYSIGIQNNCGNVGTGPDATTYSSLMRWGNWDAVTYCTNGGHGGTACAATGSNGIRFCTGSGAGNAACTASETASTDPTFPGLASPSTTFPASFYLSGQPSWWATTWGTPAWPPIGPDVTCTTNCIANTASHAAKIPAQLCYENLPKTTGFINSFDAASCYAAATGAVAPTVTTTTATSITTTTASSGGTVTSDGGASVTSEGVCYATTANPTSPCTSNGTATPFTSPLSGLSINTLYHYRAFATNSAGTSYGSDLTFTTANSTFSISGTVSPAAGSTDPNPSVVMSCPSCTFISVQTSAGGGYSFSNNPNGTYTVTPNKSGYTFSPANRVVTISGANQAAQNFTATGTATASLTPSIFNFGSQGIGISSTGKDFTLTNTGSGQLTGITISDTGTNATDFSQTTTCGATLNASATCTITAMFTPLATGARTATLQVADNAGTQTASLFGTGFQAPVPSCTPTGGTYKSGRMIACTNQVPIATMCVLSGSPPTTNGAGTCTSGTTYAGPFMVTSTGTVFVVGTQAGNTDSSVSYSYIINPTWTTGWVMNLSGGRTTFGPASVAGVCGPPLYNCSSQSTAVATLPAVPNMGGLTGVNTTGYEYSAPTDFYYPSSGHGNCITRLTDNNSESSHQSMGSTWSSGGNDLMWSTDRSYGAVTNSGGGTKYLSVHYDANGCMQVDNPVLTVLSAGGAKGGFTFSRQVRNRAFHILGNSGNGTVLNQEDLSGTASIIVTTTAIFDFAHCPGVPSVRPVQGIGGNGQLSVSSDDDVFMTHLNMSTIDGQGNGHWVLSWKRSTNACASFYTGQVLSTENPANGNVWAYCTGDCSQGGSNPSPIALDTTCSANGIHGTQGFRDGQYLVFTEPCNGDGGTYHHWRIGTTSMQLCTSTAPVTYECSGHNSVGYHREYMTNSNFSYRLNSDITTPTVFNTYFPSGIDQHGSMQWTGALADSSPWLVNAIANNLGTCSTLAYCYELVAVKLDGTKSRFINNFFASGLGLGSISTMTPDGYCMIFSSDWNVSLGLDNTASPRIDIFSVCNLQ